MSVKSNDLANRMVSQAPVNREARAELDHDALAERIARARQLVPQGRDVHCADCFRRGVQAALRVIEGA